MNEQERAEEHLKTIRRLMERATIYRAISAPTALVGGLLSLAATAVYLIWFCNYQRTEESMQGRNDFLWIWLVVLTLTAATNALFIVVGSKNRGEPVLSASMKAAFIALAPAMIAGAAFTFFSSGSGADPASDIVMSLSWCIFYGLGLLATGHFAPRSLTLLGWAFLASGILGMTALRFGDSYEFSGIDGLRVQTGAVIMAVTFGCFHLIYAACVWPRKRAAAEV